jgi:hypothetical protein
LASISCLFSNYLLPVIHLYLLPGVWLQSGIC